MKNKGRSRIRVLVVDDSAVMRKIICEGLSRDPGIEVVGTAPDAAIARNKLVTLKPDVMTLDISMPQMDGITFLEKVMRYFPTRTLIVSNLSTADSDHALRAFSAGAINVIAKPRLSTQESLQIFAEDLSALIRAISLARLAPPACPQNDALAHAAVDSSKITQKMIAFAASTGGTEALKKILSQLPRTVPGIVIVQHMPPHFTQSFAQNLDRMCRISVKEAQDGDKIVPGLALMAPGDYHMEVIKQGGAYYVRLNQGPLVHGVRPAADVLLKSVAAQCGAAALGLVLTGMGKDGAAGLLAMRNAGARTIVQDEASSVVFGMPKIAIELGAAQAVLSLNKIARGILDKLD